MKQRLIDQVEFVIKAGNGGSGLVSFRREKYIPKGGPDGGDGGNGGSIYLVANPHMTTLMDYAGRDHFEAGHGEKGRYRKQHGKDADDVTLEVPVGTVVWERSTGKPDFNADEVFKHRLTRRSIPRAARISAQENQHRSAHQRVIPSVSQPVNRQVDTPIWQKLADLNEPGMKMMIARGGAGGRGNDAFKSSTNTTPTYAEPGQPGEKKQIRLEMKILADVGLVGLPNAGKSTLLSVLTAARPEIADYPFTTITPNLGVMEQLINRPADQPKQLVIADIPGLIEDAHKGKGLGIDFLRHIERCRVLVYVISPSEPDLVGDNALLLSQLVNQYNTVVNEVKSYGHEVDQKPHLTVLNKTDLLSEDQIEAIQSEFNKINEAIIPVSAATHQGLDVLKQAVSALL